MRWPYDYYVEMPFCLWRAYLLFLTRPNAPGDTDDDEELLGAAGSDNVRTFRPPTADVLELIPKDA